MYRNHARLLSLFQFDRHFLFYIAVPGAFCCLFWCHFYLSHSPTHNVQRNNHTSHINIAFLSSLVDEHLQRQFEFTISLGGTPYAKIIETNTGSRRTPVIRPWVDTNSLISENWTMLRIILLAFASRNVSSGLFIHISVLPISFWETEKSVDFKFAMINECRRVTRKKQQCWSVCSWRRVGLSVTPTPMKYCETR